MGFDPLPITSLLALTVVVQYLLHASYRSYISHGPGGLGQHWKGFLTSATFRFAIWSAGKQVHSTDVSDLEERIAAGETRRWLRKEDVPKRMGSPPRMLPFPIPQRHVVEGENYSLAVAQLEICTTLAETYPTKLRFGCSQLEHDGPALFARSPSSPTALAPLGELMHIHLCPFLFPHPYVPNACSPTSPTYLPLPAPAPQSVHVTLSPRDAVLAIERGWALRHPASGKPPRPIPPLPAGLVLVFAPRDEAEMEVLRKFCEASAAFGAGTVEPLGEEA